MGRVQIITDSGSDLPLDMAAEAGIGIVPLTISFGDEAYKDRVDIGIEEFYKKMSEADDLPLTAAPSAGDFEALFLRAAEEGAESVVCLTISSKLSATLQSAKIAAATVSEKINVEVVDSESITSGLGQVVLEANRLSKEGFGQEAIVAACRDLVERTHAYGAISTLENLKAGGRIGGAKALLGSMLSIKPIIDISSGEVQEAAKARTRKKSFEWLRDRLAAANSPSHVAIGGGAADDLEDFLKILEPVIDLDEAWVGEIGPTIGTHAGAGVVGLTFFENSYSS